MGRVGDEHGVGYGDGDGHEHGYGGHDGSRGIYALGVHQASGKVLGPGCGCGSVAEEGRTFGKGGQAEQGSCNEILIQIFGQVGGQVRARTDTLVCHASLGVVVYDQAGCMVSTEREKSDERIWMELSRRDVKQAGEMRAAGHSEDKPRLMRTETQGISDGEHRRQVGKPSLDSQLSKSKSSCLLASPSQ